MAEITLITEQHGIDKEGNHWVLKHVDPPEWERGEFHDDIFTKEDSRAIRDAVQYHDDHPDETPSFF